MKTDELQQPHHPCACSNLNHQQSRATKVQSIHQPYPFPPFHSSTKYILARKVILATNNNATGGMSLWETFRNQKHDFTGRTPPAKRLQRQRKRQKQNQEELLQEKSSSGHALVTPSASTSSMRVCANRPKRNPGSHRFISCHHLVDEEINDPETSLRSGRLGSYENQWQQRQRRMRRSRLGLSLAHQQLMKNDQNSGNTKDRYKDGSHVIYRKKEDYSGSQMYTGCIFLNDHDRVLAADVSGKMDIIKVPQYHSGNSGRKTTPGRPLGTALLQELQIVGFAGSQPNQSTDSSSALKLQSLDDGNRFAVGMPNGNYCIVDTERSTASTSMISAATRKETPKQVISRAVPSATARIRAISTTLTHSASILPHLQATTTAGPRRKYHRAWNNSQLSLHQLLKNQGENFFDEHSFRQVYGWDQNKPRVTTPISFGLRESAPNHPNTALWDFWDSQSSSVLAAHVDAEHDCFSLWDSRHKPTAVIDTSICQSSSRAPLLDHATSCVFVSQYCLATSHVSWTPNNKTYSFSGQSSSSSVVECLPNGRLQKKSSARASSRIQLWDLRMLRAQQQPLSSIAVVPSFPQDTVLGKTPDRSFPIGAASSSNQNKGRDVSILAMQAPKSHNTVSGYSQLLVTTDSHTNGLQHHLLELTHGKIIKTISGGQPYSGLKAVAPSQHAMVCTSANGSGQSLQVYNLLDGSGSFGHGQSRTAQSTSGIKRSHLGNTPNNAGAGDSDGISFTPVVKDRHGLSTQLSCLAMNHSGNSILGGSIDGDLFLWRRG